MHLGQGQLHGAARVLEQPLHRTQAAPPFLQGQHPWALTKIHLRLFSGLGFNTPHPAWGRKRFGFGFGQPRDKAAHRLVGALKAEFAKILIDPLDAQTQAALLPDGSLKPNAGTVSAA